MRHRPGFAWVAGLFVVWMTLPAVASRAAERASSSLSIKSQPFVISANFNPRFLIQPSPELLSRRGTRIEFNLHRRVSSRDSFVAVANGVVDTAVIDTVSFSMALVTRDNGLLSLAVPILVSGSSPSSLSIRYEGVYPLTIRIVDGASGRELASTMTFVYRRDAVLDRDPVSVTALLNVTTMPSFAPDGSVEITSETRTTVQRAVDLLSTAADPITVCIQPEVVAALATASDTDSIRLMEDLRAVLRGRSVVASTFAPVDPSWLSANGMSGELLRQMELGRSVMRRYLPEITLNEKVWVATSALNERALATLREGGITTIVLTSNARGSVKSEAPPSIITHPGDSRNKTLVVLGADPRMSTLLEGTPQGAQQLGYRVAAEALVEVHDLLVAGYKPDNIGVVVSSPSGAVHDIAAMRTALRALAASPGVAVRNAANDVWAGAQPWASVFPKSGLSGDASFAASVKSMRKRVDSVMSMLDGADIRRDGWAYSLAIASSTSAESPRTYIDALRGALSRTLDVITVSTQGNVNLSSRRGAIRIQMRNDSATDLTVRVTVASTKLSIVQPTRTVTLKAGSTTDVKVEATTRTNGRFPVTVRVLTPQGGLQILPPITITARVSAIAGFGQLISVTLLLVLVAWWWSHRRRATSEEATGPRAETTVDHQ